MKTKYYVLLGAGLFLPALVFSQKYTLHAALQDTAQAPLEAATVMLLNPKDSSLLFFTRSQTGGSFEFKNLAAGDYLLRATFFGYQNVQQALTVGGSNLVVDLGVLRMKVKNTLLGEVAVTGEANPVTIKNDTIEFNAGSFRVKENAMVEDLLRKLPGVEVERDGTVKAQGEEVKNVLVDGKRFFGADPKIATQNLPADAVDKVQVYDKKSEQAVFSGIDDGQREKTINLDLREDKKNGWFGVLAAGAGSDLNETPNDFRYEGRASLNRFKPKQQLSLLGMGNNANQAGFSIDDYMAFSGAMRQMMGGRGGAMRIQINSDDSSIPLDFGGQTEGFLNTWAGGVNFNQEYGQQRTGDLNTSYFFSQADRDYERSASRESFLPTGNFQSTDRSVEDNVADNHRLNLTLEQKIDSFHSVQLTSALAYSDTRSVSNTVSETLDAAGFRQNDGLRDYQSDATGINWTGGFLYRQKFAKKGRSFSSNLTAGLNNSQSESSSFAANRFFGDNNLPFQSDTIAQVQDFENDVLNLGARATYTEPLGKRRYLEVSYNYSLTESRADKAVYDMLAGERNFNPLLSNAYTNRFDYHRAGLGLRFNRKAWNASAGIDAQSATLDGKVTSGQGQPLRQTFGHLLPRLDFNYDFTPSRHLRLGYTTNINAPSVQQLQPIPDLSDPLNVIEGNPNLKPEYAHSLNASFVQFNPETMRSFFSMLFFTYTQDRILNAQSVDSFFVRRYRPVNVASDYRLFGNLAYGMPWKKIKSRFSLRTEGSVNRGLNLINDVENYTTGLVLGQAVSWDFNPADWFSLSASAELSWNQTRYSIDQAFNQEYVRQTYSAEINLELPQNWALNTALNVTQNTGLAAGYDQAIPIWNASISRFLLKNKRGELTLSVRDLLNRNVGINRTANLNYVEDVRTAALGRFATLKFTYSLNKMGGGQSGGPGFRMMIRR
ncbi:MAG: TonB-dependent receptor family protein [Saprospirales bacterium]|nr:TonB-dependent receptor family protein [Saprospirales bacterium]